MIFEKSIFFEKIDFLGCGTIFHFHLTFFLGVRAPKFFFWRKLSSIGKLYKKSGEMSDMSSYLYFDFRGHSGYFGHFWNRPRAIFFEYFRLWVRLRAKNIPEKNLGGLGISEKQNLRNPSISRWDMVIYFWLFFFPLTVIVRFLVKNQILFF